MDDSNLRKILEDLAIDLQGNHNRKVLGMKSMDEYIIEKESLIEEVISKINNAEILSEIQKLKRMLR